jgi:hypothetical protein
MTEEQPELSLNELIDLLPAVRQRCVNPATGELDYPKLVNAAIEVALLIDDGLEVAALRLIAAPDYGAALAEAARLVGRPVEATRRPDGAVGVAMVVHGPETDVLVASVGLLATIFSDDPEARRFALNTFHHELCHGHDAAVRRRTVPGAFQERPRGSGWSYLLLSPVADTLWSEYSANRRSFATAPKGECIHAPMLAEELPRLARAAGAAIASFRTHGDVVRLLRELAPDVQYVFRLLGYVLGTLSASGGALEERNPEAAPALAASCLRETWRPAAEQLDRMYRSAGHWRDLESTFAPLEELVRGAFLHLGLRLEEGDGAPRLFLA